MAGGHTKDFAVHGPDLKHIEWRWFNRDTDMEAVTALHGQMEKRLGRNMDLPELDRRPVIASVVGETNGLITHGVFAEVEAEICAIGPNILPASEARGAEHLLLPALRYYDLRIARCYVPSAMLTAGKRGRPAAMARMLKGMNFTQENETMKQWFRWLATEKEGS